MNYLFLLKLLRLETSGILLLLIRNKLLLPLAE